MRESDEDCEDKKSSGKWALKPDKLKIDKADFNYTVDVTELMDVWNEEDAVYKACYPRLLVDPDTNDPAELALVKNYLTIT